MVLAGGDAGSSRLLGIEQIRAAFQQWRLPTNLLRQLADGPLLSNGQLNVSFSARSSVREAVTTYSENGVEVRSLSGRWLWQQGYGNPAPYLGFDLVAPDTTQAASVSVTAQNKCFRFVSIDVYSSLTPVPYIFTGFDGPTKAFEVRRTLANTYGAFDTVENPRSDAAIDRLEVTLSTTVTSLTSTPGSVVNPVGIDNIILAIQPDCRR
jgi:hypothetical protein